MSLESDLQTLLKDAAAVVTIVAGNPNAAGDKCIRRERLFQSDKFPAIEIHLENEENVDALEGDNGTVNAHVVITCLAEDQGVARSLGRAVKERLEPFHGATASGFVDSVTYVKTRNAWDAFEDGTDKGLHASEVHFQVWYFYD